MFVELDDLTVLRSLKFLMGPYVENVATADGQMIQTEDLRIQKS
jgi:hypothetical protein